MSTFRRNLESMIDVCRAHGVGILFCTMAFRVDKLDLDELPHDAKLNALLGELIDRDNDLVREVARRHDVPVVETARISERVELFLDDAHLNAEGHRLEAEIVRDGLLPMLDGR